MTSAVTSDVKKEAKTDKDWGYHSFVINQDKFTVNAFYLPTRPAGRGAYGTVAEAKDLRSPGIKVAVKHCRHVLEDTIDCIRVIREIKLMRAFNHPNIMSLKDIVPPCLTTFENIHLVMPMMDIDANHVFATNPNQIQTIHLSSWMYQIFCGLAYMHQAGVYHRDLKPSNLLCNADTHMKITDFGLSRCMKDSKSPAMSPKLTEYVVTRWYRAPEVLCSGQYDGGIDMWSAGCILAQWLDRDRALLPGNDQRDQIKTIIANVGMPSEEDLASLQ